MAMHTPFKRLHALSCAERQSVLSRRVGLEFNAIQAWDSMTANGKLYDIQ